MPGQDKPMQALPPDLKSARAWAKKVLVPGARVEIYEQSEKLVETMTDE